MHWRSQRSSSIKVLETKQVLQLQNCDPAISEFRTPNSKDFKNCQEFHCTDYLKTDPLTKGQTYVKVICAGSKKQG